MDRNTGRLALSDPLDYERDSNVYAIRIRAEEVGIIPKLSSEVNVKILLKDINDNPPEFSRQRYRYKHLYLKMAVVDSNAGGKLFLLDIFLRFFHFYLARSAQFAGEKGRR